MCVCVVCMTEFVWLLDAFGSGDLEDKGFKAEVGKAQKANTRIPIQSVAHSPAGPTER